MSSAADRLWEAFAVARAAVPGSPDVDVALTKMGTLVMPIIRDAIATALEGYADVAVANRALSSQELGDDLYGVAARFRDGTHPVEVSGEPVAVTVSRLDETTETWDDAPREDQS